MEKSKNSKSIRVALRDICRNIRSIHLYNRSIWILFCLKHKVWTFGTFVTHCDWKFCMASYKGSNKISFRFINKTWVQCLSCKFFWFFKRLKCFWELLYLEGEALFFYWRKHRMIATVKLLDELWARCKILETGRWDGRKME